MQFNSDKSDKKKDSVPKYFTENVYREFAKSMNDFTKDAVTSGDNINMASRSKPEVAMKHDLFSTTEPKTNYHYSSVYYLNPVVNTHMSPVQTISHLTEFQTSLQPNQNLIPKNYEGILNENAVLTSKEEYTKPHLTPYLSKTHIEEDINTSLLKCIKSSETSPNFITSSKEKYDIKPEINSVQITNELKRGELGVAEDEKKYCVGQTSQNAYHNKQFDYGFINYNRCQSENVIPNQEYYFPVLYNQHLMQKKQNIDENINYMTYKPKKDVCYFNSIRPVYDENTKSYMIDYEVIDETNSNSNYRHQMLPNELINSRNISPLFKYISEGTPFNAHNPYDNIDPYYKTNSIKQDLRELQQKLETQSKITQTDLQSTRSQDEKKRISRSTSAGRPKLNRNHFSCSKCSTKTTPQWRYVTGDAVCNACYMRHRKEKVYSFQNIKGKGKKSKKNEYLCVKFNILEQ